MFDFNLMAKLLTVPGIVIGFAFHEFAHAWVADRLGDPTPRNQGKLTFDPRAHIDPIGFILILIVGFGWAKPVQTNPSYFKNPRRDDTLVSLAGPAMNLVIAIFFAIILKLILSSNMAFDKSVYDSIKQLFTATIYINVLLFVLNMIPFPFYDGYFILRNYFQTWRYQIFAVLEQYSLVIFVILAMTGVLSRIISPIVREIFVIIIRTVNL